MENTTEKIENKTIIEKTKENTEKNGDIVKRESIFKKPWVQSLAGIFLIILILGGVLIYKSISSRVAIDLGTIQAPVITISPDAPGILDSIYVGPGDNVIAGQALAHVGGETLYSKIPGIILTAENVPGQVFNPGQAVVTMIDPTELRIVGIVDENGGLSFIKVGDPATFTVDAFGGKEFTGIVEEISPTSKQSGVTFSISDKREIKQFTVKIKYDNSAHPEFKNGMSAKIKVYIKNK